MRTPVRRELIDVAADDWAFAELAARTGLEPELASRYSTNPLAVLAEFGISELPIGGATMAGPLVIEDLDAAQPASLVWCVLCTSTFTPRSPGR